MERKKMFKRLVFLLIVVVVFQLGREVFRKEERAARNYVYDQVKSAFPDANDKVQALYGVKPYKHGAFSTALPGPAIVLVHGLDEPGRVWMNLAPVLDKRGYIVFFMYYPNDQTITASARMFFDALKAVNQNGDHHLVIIGHSMGGLVSREMLTAPEINYSAAAAAGQVPVVSDLIMVGTPNHGSQLARFRFFMEIKDQVQNLFEDEVDWRQGILDGTGAAGIDLLPGSAFLTRLNRRPHPPGVNLYVIAGILSPWTGADIHRGIQALKEYLPLDRHGMVKGLETDLNTINATIGDGLVTLESARLDNISLTQVKGNHLTMIRNLTRSSKRTPPAIPVILGVLEKPEE